ncbi:hypothetical protein Tco_1268370 [Tanacetum coccineum]
MLAYIHIKLIYSASTIIHSEFASGHDVSADFKSKVDLGKSDPNDSVSKHKEKTKSASEGLETFLTKHATGKGASYIEKEIEYVEEEFNTSPDLSINHCKDEEEEEVHAEKDDAEKVQPAEPKEIEDALASHPPSPSKSLPTELKELPFKFNNLSGEIKELKKYVKKLEVELRGDLKKIPNKLEKFTSIVSSLITHVVELKTLQLEPLAKFLSLPGQVSSIQAKIKTLDALPSILSKLLSEDKGKKAMSSKDAKEEGTESESDDANLTIDQIKKQKKLEELAKADMAKQEGELGKQELVDLLGIDIVKGFYKAKL